MVVVPDEFEPVAERVGGKEAAHARDGVVPERRVTGSLKPRRERVDVGDDDARMRLAGRPELRLDAEMDLDGAAADPDAAALRELGRFLKLHHAKNVDVEDPALRLRTRRNRNLHMVEAPHRAHAAI